MSGNTRKGRSLHHISSLTFGDSSPVPSSERTDTTHRTALRLHRVEKSQVDSQAGHSDKTKGHKKEGVRTRDIVKIFTSDKDFIIVSPEQLNRVRSMHKKIADAAHFTFNYNTLLVVASILAGLGLLSNSSTTIIASMLVSPIMGPVIGLAYGCTIRDWKLVWTSARTELISILLCIIIGGALVAVTGHTELVDDWPTSEMTSRGSLQAVYVSLPTAFFSGLGVAVSLLDDQTSSLVGVAISASLLPPAVNAGALWICHVYVENDFIPHPSIPLPAPAPNDDVSDRDIGSCEPGTDDPDCLVYDTDLYYRGGARSLIITVANILLIWVASMLMFRIKEILPIEKSVFWSDLGVARKVYQNRAVLQHSVQAIDSATTADLDVTQQDTPGSVDVMNQASFEESNESKEDHHDINQPILEDAP